MSLNGTRITPELLEIARKMAWKYFYRFGGNVDFADLHSDANLAVVKSAAAFDPTKGKSFQNFALRSIQFALLDSARRADILYTQQERRKIQKGFIPKIYKTIISVEELNDAMSTGERATDAEPYHGLDVQVFRRDNGGLPDLKQLDNSCLLPLMQKELSPVEYHVVWHVVVLGYTASSLAKTFSVTKMTVGNWLRRGIEKLRRAYRATGALLEFPNQSHA